MAYEIKVARHAQKGRLTFTSGNVAVDTACWWKRDNRVDAGTYTGYATRMASKTDGADGGKREAVWLGRNVPMNNATHKSNDIFIHKGTGPSWSDGCIVCAESELVKIWSTIEPKERANITITITDEGTGK
jgi:hypothetical protein